LISDVVSTCIIGNMGGAAVRWLLEHGLEGQRIVNADSRAHLPCRHVRKALEITGPIIGIVRNPFDWYIATYQTELQYHRWRGSFQDWFYHRRHIGGQYLREEKVREGPWLWDLFTYFAEIEPGSGPTGYTHILRYECLLQDFIAAMQDIGIIPEMIAEEWVREKFPYAISNNNRRQWFEGIEQWMRPDHYTAEMLERVYEQDAPIFERYGYTFNQRTYYLGGCGQSCHNTQIGNWEQEKELWASWEEWVPERPGPFVRS